MAKVFVTGGSGFIGQHLVRRLLARGDDVVCLVRDIGRGDGIRKSGARLVVGKLNDVAGYADALRDREVVYHLAGLTRARTADEFQLINEAGTKQLAEACAALPKPPIFVMTSSLAAAGVSPLGSPRVESDANVPVSDYGHSKLAAEVALTKLAHKLPITILRPPMVLGPGDPISLGMFRVLSKFRIHAMPGRGRNEYAWVDARDLVSAMIMVAEKGERLTAAGHSHGQGVYFVNNVDNDTYVKLGTEISQALGGVKYVRAAIPAFLTDRAAKWSTILSPREVPYLNRDKAREITAGSWSSSAAKIRTQLGFAPPIDQRARLREIADWYRNKGWL